MLEAVLHNMKPHGRIPACGMISQYNLKEGEGVRNLFSIVAKEIHVHGFLVSSYVHVFPKFYDFIMPLVREGKVTYVEDVAEGLENAAAALVGLFSGRNFGKQLVRLASE